MGNSRFVLPSLIAVLAALGCFTPGAMAETFHLEAAPATLSGSQTGEFSFGVESGEIGCESLSFAGSVEATETTELALSPSSAGCTAFGASASYDWNGCKWVPTSSQVLHLTCPTGQKVELTGVICDVTYPPQTSAATVTYTNVSGRLVAHVSSTSIVYEEHGFFCSTGVKTDGTYSGTFEVTAEAEGSEVGISWE